MQSPLQITTRGIDHPAALDANIRDNANKLEAFFNQITSCRVLVEVPHKHHQQGNQFSVRIEIGVLGKEIVVNHDHAEDVYVAVHTAFDAAKQQIEDYARKIRGDLKTHATRQMRPYIEKDNSHIQVIDDR